MKKRNLVLFGTVATLSLALAGSIGAVTASADKVISDQATGEQGVELSYEVSEKWTVTITDSISLQENGSGTITVTASDLVLSEGEKLKVSVSDGHEGAWQLQTSGGASIGYDVKLAGTSIKTTGTVLENVDGNTDAGQLTKELTVELDGEENAKVAGTYTDTLTFSVEVA